MSEVLSVRLSAETKKKLEKSAKAAKRSKSFIAAEAIEAYLEEEAWNIRQIKLGLADAAAGRLVPHEEVSAWLKTWGKPGEKKAPRPK